MKTQKMTKQEALEVFLDTVEFEAEALMADDNMGGWVLNRALESFRKNMKESE